MEDKKELINEKELRITKTFNDVEEMNNWISNSPDGSNFSIKINIIDAADEDEAFSKFMNTSK